MTRVVLDWGRGFALTAMEKDVLARFCLRFCALSERPQTKIYALQKFRCKLVVQSPKDRIQAHTASCSSRQLTCRLHPSHTAKDGGRESRTSMWSSPPALMIRRLRVRGRQTHVGVARRLALGYVVCAVVVNVCVRREVPLEM